MEITANSAMVTYSPTRAYALAVSCFRQRRLQVHCLWRGFFYCPSDEPLEVVRIPRETVKISAGYHHPCAITEAANVLFVPTKVECLTGMVIKMAALGSEHSIAVTGFVC